MGIYSAYFAESGVPKTGLTPSFRADELRRLDTAALIDITGTTWSEVGGGFYKLSVGLVLAATLPDSPVVGVIDGGAALTDARDRFVPARLNSEDFGRVGPGAKHVELVIKETDEDPIPGASVWVTTGDDPEASVVAGPEVTDAFGKVTFMLDPSPIQQEGAVQAATASSITLETAASGVDDAYNRKIVRITAGLGSGQSRPILDYDGPGRLATLTAPWTVQPDGTSHYQVVEAYRRWAQLSGRSFAENPSLFDVS